MSSIHREPREKGGLQYNYLWMRSLEPDDAGIGLEEGEGISQSLENTYERRDNTYFACFEKGTAFREKRRGSGLTATAFPGSSEAPFL